MPRPSTHSGAAQLCTEHAVLAPAIHLFVRNPGAARAARRTGMVHAGLRVVCSRMQMGARVDATVRVSTPRVLNESSRLFCERNELE